MLAPSAGERRSAPGFRILFPSPTTSSNGRCVCPTTRTSAFCRGPMRLGLARGDLVGRDPAHVVTRRVVGQFEIAYGSPIASTKPASLWRAPASPALVRHAASYGAHVPSDLHMNGGQPTGGLKIWAEVPGHEHRPPPSGIGSEQLGGGSRSGWMLHAASSTSNANAKRAAMTASVLPPRGGVVLRVRARLRERSIGHRFRTLHAPPRLRDRLRHERDQVRQLPHVIRQASGHRGGSRAASGERGRSCSA